MELELLCYSFFCFSISKMKFKTYKSKSFTVKFELKGQKICNMYEHHNVIYDIVPCKIQFTDLVK